MIPTWGAAFGANAIFNSAEFRADLTHSAVPDKAATGTTGTFTRATTKTVENNDGYLVTLLAGEIGFPGARRVRNLIRTDFSSENMTLNNITAFPVAITPNDITPPAGYSRADRQTSTTPASRSGAYMQSTSTVAAGGVVILRCVAKPGTGRYLCMGDQADSNWHVMTLDTQTGSVSLGGTAVSGEGEDLGDGWWRLTLKFIKDATGVVGILCCHSDAAGNSSYPGLGQAGEYWWATGFQIEDVTAQTTQTAGEYVSVGVPSDWAGDELVTNGTFDTDTTGWTEVNSTFSQPASDLRITNVGANAGYGHQAITTVVGTKYVCSANITVGTSATFGVYFGNSPGSGALGGINGSASGFFTGEFTATATTTYISPINTQAVDGRYTTFDNISVKPAAYHGSMVDGVACFDYYYLD